MTRTLPLISGRRISLKYDWFSDPEDESSCDLDGMQVLPLADDEETEWDGEDDVAYGIKLAA